MDKIYTRWTRQACENNHCFRMTTSARTTVGTVSLCFVVGILLLSAVSFQGVNAAASIVYMQTPSNVTSRTNATFGFNVVDENGTNPCAIQQICSFRCKLDQSPMQDCLNREASFSNLGDGLHVFSIFVNTSDGPLVSSEFRWTIDTVAPTALVDGGQAFTNGQNVTVNITFSEVCDGFVCTNASSCDLLVYGAGAVVASSLKEIEKGRMYSVVAVLSTESLSGKIVTVIARNACADAAGNRLQRTNQSSSVIRFDRTIPSVNLWTAVPSSAVVVDNQRRTCEATNQASDLMVYLDFDSPVTSSADELLRFLSASGGVLTTAARKSLGNRRFGFRLINITKDFSEVTITLAENAVSNRYGTLVPGNNSITFLYDNERPQVHVSTNSRAKTKDTRLPFVVQFTEPVFGFNTSGVTISGGTVTSFMEIDNATYALEVEAMENKLVTVTVPENRSVDFAGNSNLASFSIQVRHYVTPWVSVVLYYLITVGLVATALVSGALSVSSATLVAAGAVSDRKIGDPSRNLLGLVSHLQVLSLSGWLAVSLPAEYREVTKGLRWLIPHISTPWQEKGVIETGNGNFTDAPTVVQDVIKARRRLLSVDARIHALQHRGRLLGDNATLYGPALGPGDYELFFQGHVSGQAAALKTLLGSNKNSGWQDFQRNMFWIGVIGGSIILLHIMLVLVLRWRTRAPIRGALTVPRFELYFLILAIPGVCQASGFIIRGGEAAGIIVGGFLLVVPAACLVSILVFLTYGVFLGALVKYKEFRYEVHRHGYIQPQKPQGFVNLVAGTGYPGKWVRNSRLAPTFLPRYGLIFEDHKGPPSILVHKKVESVRHSIRRAGSTMDKVDSDDEPNDVVEVSDSHRILGDARAAYILVDLSRRIALGLVFGLYPESDQSWSQVGVALGVSVVQFGYLAAVKPFRRRGVQVVETISLLCEVAIFATAMALLVKGHPAASNDGVGVFMLAFLVISFVFQLVNEWYILLERLMRLSTTPEASLKEGFKKFAGGLILPFIPRRLWTKFLGPQGPQSSSETVFTSDSQQRRDSKQQALSWDKSQQFLPLHDKPFALPQPVAIPNSDSPVPGSRNSNTESIAQITAVDVDSDRPTSTEEITVEPSPRSRRHLSRTQWGSCVSAGDERRSRDDATQELKILRELAKASFSRSRKDSDYDIEQRAFGSPSGDVRGLSGSLQKNSSPAESMRNTDGNRFKRRRQLFGMPQRPVSDSDSISLAPSDGDSVFLQEEISSTVPEVSNLVFPPVISPSNSDRSNVSKELAGRAESSLRDSGGVIRPLEDR